MGQSFLFNTKANAVDLQHRAAQYHHPAGVDRRHHRHRRDAGHHPRRHRPVVGSVVGATAMIAMSFAQTALVNGQPSPKMMLPAGDGKICR